MKPDLDPFLQDALEDAADADALAALVATLAPVAPSPALRERLLDSVAAAPAPAAARALADVRARFYRFADKIAALVDVTVETARDFIDQLADPARWERDLFPGMDAVWVPGGPAAANCIRGFARLAAGTRFPDHDHLGSETQLILEGAMIDSRGFVGHPGDLVEAGPGTEHAYTASPDGPDLVLFVVVREGVIVSGTELRHRDAPAV